MIKKMNLTINAIKGTPPRAGQTVPGDLIINNDQWFSRREFRNLVVSSGLSADLPYMAFIGMKGSYELLTVDQKMIDDGIASGVTVKGADGKERSGYIHTIQGREVAYAKPGTHNINLQLDLSSLLKDYGFGEVIKTSAELIRMREGTVTPTAAPARAAVSSTTLADPNDNTANDNKGPKVIPMPDIIKDIKDDPNGNKVNADGSALSKEQQEALSAWVEATALADPIAN